MNKLFFDEKFIRKIIDKTIISLAEINQIDKSYFSYKIYTNPKKWPIEFLIKPRYSKLCEKNIFPKYMLNISLAYFIKTSLNNNKYLFMILIACIPHFREYLDFEFKRWGWLSKFKSFNEFLYYLEKNWMLNKFELIILEDKDLKILESTALTTYRHINNIFSLLGDKVYLWTYSDLNKLSFGLIDDFTNLDKEEILNRIPGLIYKAAETQDKLKQKYMKKIESKKVIKIDSCRQKLFNLGVWVLASW
ncbi:MAG: hypothetical protein J7K23_07185 [Thermoproteales archaeon]|nr:hypothetical protein [Thermoproteales archaeon]